MSVTFGAVGPSSSGTQVTASPATWAHTCAAGQTELLIGISVDANPDTSRTATCTYNGITCSSVLRWESGGAAQNVGFVQVFRLLSPPTGSAFTVSAAVSGSFNTISGGSLSFAGSASLSAAVHADSNGVGVTSGSIVIPTTSANDMAVAFVANGSGFNTGFTAGTQRYIAGVTSSAAAGFVGAATIPATGSNVTISWAQNSDFFGAIGLVVQAAGAGVGILPQQTKHRMPAYFTRLNSRNRGGVYSR